MRLHDLADDARRRLEAAGVARADAGLDVEVLARHLLGWDRATWLTRRDEDAAVAAGGAAFASAFAALVARRCAREPIAYIRGTQEFYGRQFSVGPGVLIPRPESELVVDEALAEAAGPPHPRSTRIADIGTGSGILAITLALEIPGALLTATDVSADALAAARRNADTHGVARSVTLVATSYLDGVGGPFEMVVANPPYVRGVDAATLAPEVRDFEPPSALFGGADGLRDIAGVATAAAARLVAGGTLVMEIGIDQADAAAAIVRAEGLRVIRIRPDLQGIPRVVVARK